ncbi:MAG: hypothetical protein KDD27_10465 [Saprospiraceae bacterium]|nr:hypothetical protein [Saprospiraceae bacterium]
MAGFSNRGPQSGDQVYLAVKQGKKLYIGARFLLDEVTDRKPWPDAERYLHAMTVKDVEFCEPFELTELHHFDPYWYLKFVQGSKPINSNEALQYLKGHFESAITKDLYHFVDMEEEATEEQPETIEDEKEAAKIIRKSPELGVSIMGTFQTVRFANESDKIKGLEVLVNRHFYHLFPQFLEKNTLLIPENRLFKTEGIKHKGNKISEISTIPDALLIVFNRSAKYPLQINLVEYECYGEGKLRSSEKSNYLNTHIIPQLMRFASSFSIITDEKTRETSIANWTDKIIDFLNAKGNEANLQRMIDWVKLLKPDVRERSLEREIERYLTDAFRSSFRVLLVIDELSPEQKLTIKNVINSFKLPSDTAAEFSAYVVKLVQKIDLLDEGSEFALTVEEV